ADGNRLNEIRIDAFHAQELPPDDVIAAVYRRDSELFSFQILNVFDDFRADHQIVNTLFEQDEHRLHRQSLHNAPKCADKGAGEDDDPVQHRHCAQPRIDLNELDIQSFLFEKSFGLGDVIGRVGIAAARERDADLLRLRAGALLAAKNPEERSERYRNAP